MKKIIGTVIAICVILAATFISASSFRKGKTVQTPAPELPVRLNDTLTNSMSEFPALEGMDKKIEAYLRQWEIRGASLSVIRNDSLVYSKGYGWADEEKGIAMSPGHILRIASVSKLITAAGIMTLQEKGLLNIKDTVFGSTGILNDSLYVSNIKDRNYRRITVEHLLRHQGGFYRDPMFSSRDVMTQLRLDHAPTNEDMIGLVLKRPLRFMPGKSQKYSNFGYMLLSRIIEKVSGEDYETYIRTKVLRPAGCYDMHIAGNYYEDRFPNEVRYYTHSGDGKFIEEFNNSGKMVERSYGGNDVTSLSGAGAWCASTAELARFVASIDGRPEIPDILSMESIEAMTEYFDENTYSLGWNDTAPEKGWTRTGTFSGTSALIKYFPDGECWIFVSNTSTWKGPGQAKYTNSLFEYCREHYGDALPQRDMFGS